MNIGQGNGQQITSAAEIVGRTLFARTSVPLTRVATDTAAVIYTVSPGESVGTVYSYLAPRPPERNRLWWVFHDQSGREYYAEHQTGRYDFEALRAQGVLTTEERLEEEAEENRSLEDKLIDAGKNLAIIGIAVFAAVQLLPKLFPSSSST